MATAAKTTSWDELTGSKNWHRLVEPELDDGLREFILRCGDFCQATYDAFNSTLESPNYGNSNCGKSNFFRNVMLKDASRYHLVSFLYATTGLGSDFDKNLMVHPRSPCPWDKESNWFGNVAVTNDTVSRTIGRSEVYVACRGTIMKVESATPLFSPHSAANKFGSGGFLWWGKKEPTVHDGWLNIYTSQNSLSPYVKSSARAQLRSTIEEIKKKYAGEKLSVIVTGHSLGGSLATLSVFDLAENAWPAVNLKILQDSLLSMERKIPAMWWMERNKGMEYDEAKDEWIFDPPPPADQMVTLSL